MPRYEQNFVYNRIEIYFDDRNITYEERQYLKEHHFRWNTSEKCYTGKDDEYHLNAAKEVCRKNLSTYSMIEVDKGMFSDGMVGKRFRNMLVDDPEYILRRIENEEFIMTYFADLFVNKIAKFDSTQKRLDFYNANYKRYLDYDTKWKAAKGDKNRETEIKNFFIIIEQCKKSLSKRTVEGIQEWKLVSNKQSEDKKIREYMTEYSRLTIYYSVLEVGFEKPEMSLRFEMGDLKESFGASKMTAMYKAIVGES